MLGRLEPGDEVVHVGGAHAEALRLEAGGREGRVAEPPEVHVAADDAVLIRSWIRDEQLGAEAVRGRPARQRGRRSDELLVRGGQAQHIRAQLEHGTSGGQVVHRH
jgi:hypothetical protein